MEIIFIVISGILSAVAMVPYLINIIRRKTKPRIVSWFVWSLLAAIGFAAAVIEGQVATAILLGIATMGTFSIVILGHKFGDRTINKLDVVCLIGALLGIVFWQISGVPAVGVIIAIAADFVGGIPTLVHSWNKPTEETWITFLLSSAGATFTILALTDWRITAFAFPLYLVFINLLTTLIIIGRKRLGV